MVTFQLCILVILPLISGLIHRDPNEILNWCIDAKHHKTRPGPTDGLHEQCKPWERRSCCTKNTTVSVHTDNMYNFNWDHCNHVKPMSPNCRRHFVQDLCFYQCSPNTGPWVVKVNGSKIRNERFFQIPLCASECRQWFSDCAEDYTCTDNWVRNFDWSTGTNLCFTGTSCRSYRSVFVTAENFCESVWDHSWKVVPDTEPCMKMWFEGGVKGNPNNVVAQKYVEKLIQNGRLRDILGDDVSRAPVNTQLATFLSVVLLALGIAATF